MVRKMEQSLETSSAEIEDVNDLQLLQRHELAQSAPLPTHRARRRHQVSGSLPGASIDLSFLGDLADVPVEIAFGSRREDTQFANSPEKTEVSEVFFRPSSSAKYFSARKAFSRATPQPNENESGQICLNYHLFFRERLRHFYGWHLGKDFGDFGLPKYNIPRDAKSSRLSSSVRRSR